MSKKGCFKMETEHLIIGSPSSKDAPALKAIQNSAFVLKYNCMSPYDDQRISNQILQDQNSKNAFYLYHKTDHHLIGVVQFDEDDLRYQADSLSLSYYLQESDAHKGYMSEALKFLIPYMFEKHGLKVITCRVFKENTASIKLVEKLGFIKEGCLKHAVRAHSGIVYDDCLYAYYRKKDTI